MGSDPEQQAPLRQTQLWTPQFRQLGWHRRKLGRTECRDLLRQLAQRARHLPIAGWFDHQIRPQNLSWNGILRFGKLAARK